MATPLSVAGIREITEKRKTDDPKRYKIVEIFYTIQGEGDHAGEAAIFVRFSHCNLACEWCDTAYDTGLWMTKEEVVNAVDHTWCKDYKIDGLPIIVMTGGEPSLQVDEALVSALQTAGYPLTMETNGILWKPIMSAFTTITVSPKTKNGWWTERYPDRARFTSIKVVYDLANPHFHEILARARIAPHRKLYIQPLENQADKSTNVDLVIEFIKTNPTWKLSLQTHKILGVR